MITFATTSPQPSSYSDDPTDADDAQAAKNVMDCDNLLLAELIVKLTPTSESNSSQIDENRAEDVEVLI